MDVLSTGGGTDLRQKVLCGYRRTIQTRLGSDVEHGAVVIHVARSSDIMREFDLVMRQQKSQAWVMLWYLPEAEQPHF